MKPGGADQSPRLISRQEGDHRTSQPSALKGISTEIPKQEGPEEQEQAEAQKHPVSPKPLLIIGDQVSRLFEEPLALPSLHPDLR